MEGLKTFPGDKESLLTSGWNDDFDQALVTRWTAVVVDTGTVAQDADDPNGVINLSGGANDDGQAYMYRPFTGALATGKNHMAIARVQFTEANTNDANVIFGISSATPAANSLVDAGGGPVSSYSGAVWFKTFDTTRWQFESSVSTTQTTTEVDATAGGSSYQTLGIEIIPFSATEFWAIPWIDTAGRNNLVQPFPYSANPNPRQVAIKHRVTWASGVPLCVFFGVRNGSANAEILKVDLSIFRRTR
jgi:hypothetical protein